MKRALELANQAIGQTSPNPLVGAVIVKNNIIVGEGCHHKAGTPHAEINALTMAGQAAEGATIYVTLEPCSHYGRTPPCTKAIIAAQIKKVVIAVLDPNPLVSGRGVKELQAAGIEIEIGLLEEEARITNEVFFKWINTRIPFVVAKYAMTIDGKIATTTGHSRWISCEETLIFAHQLRAKYDAVLIGADTLRKDDPELNVRLAEGKNPTRIVVSSDGNLPLTHKIFVGEKITTIIAVKKIEPVQKEKLLKFSHVEVMEIDGDTKYLCVESLLRALGKQNITSVLIEGGSKIHAEFFQKRLVDKVHICIAPKIIGGDNAYSPVADMGITNINEALLLQDCQYEKIGTDLMITAYMPVAQPNKLECTKC